MSVRKASDSNTQGKKYNDGSAGASKIGDVVDDPTVGTVTVAGTVATVPFTVNGRGGTASFYTATSTPGSITATSATSPITVSGLSEGTTYTFVVKGTNPAGIVGPNSGVSNSITTPAAYTLRNTFTSSGTYSVPNTGVTQLSVLLVGAGGQGNSGNSGNPGNPGNVGGSNSPNPGWNIADYNPQPYPGGSSGNPGSAGNSGSGGYGGGKAILEDYSVDAGSNYTITVGNSGGSTAFGNVVTVNQNVNSNVSLASSQTGAGTGGNQADLTSSKNEIGSLAGGGGGGNSSGASRGTPYGGANGVGGGGDGGPGGNAGPGGNGGGGYQWHAYLGQQARATYGPWVNHAWGYEGAGSGGAGGAGQPGAAGFRGQVVVWGR